jgi:molecular chaperone HtpG
VQNAVDSYVEFTAQIPEEPSNEVRVDVRDRSIIIYDRGIGMGEREVNEAKKIALPTKPQRDRQYVGFRKLGIWSGLAASKKLIIETSKYGEPYKYRMVMNFEDIASNIDKTISIKQLLDPNVRIERTAEKAEEHYTEVELQDVLQQYSELLDLERVKQVIIDHCPIHFASSFSESGSIEEKLKGHGINFYKVFVRGEQIYRDFPNAVSELEWTPLKIDSKTVAVAWYTLNKTTGKLILENNYQRRNISLRIKNFAVGERGIYSSNDDYSKQQGFVVIDSPENLDWYIGEVHILDNEIIPDTPRKRIQETGYSRLFIAELRQFYNGLALKTRVHSTYISAKNHIRDANEALEKFRKKPSDEENIDALKKVFQYLETDDKKSKGNRQSLVAKEQATVLARKELRDERRILIKEISKTLEQKVRPKAATKVRREYLFPLWRLSRLSLT